MPINSWSEFWKKERSAFFKIMRMSTAVFAHRFVAHFKIKPDHKILDFGCGPGFLLDHLTANGANVSGTDINDFFVEECRKKYPEIPVYKISSDPQEMKAVLEQCLQGQKFDFIILLSVSQYLESKDQLEAILKSLKGFLAGNGTMVIADVVTPATSSIADLTAVAKHCAASGNIISLIMFLRYLLFSNYRKLSKHARLQCFSDQDMQKIAITTGLVYSRIEGLTLHPTRLNYALQNHRQTHNDAESR